MILSYIPSYLTQVLKVEETTGLLIISITMALMIPLALYFGKLSDKIGNKRVVQIGLLGLTVFAIPAFLLIGNGHIAAIFAGIFVLGFFLSVYEGTLPSLLPSLFSPMYVIEHFPSHLIFLYRYSVEQHRSYVHT